MKTKLISLASMMVILVLMINSCDDTTDEPQVTTGTISGTVTDNNSGVGILADVTLVPGNIIHTTGNDGSYSYQGLDPAVTYSLSAKSDNYDEMVKNNITVTAGETTTVNFALAVAAGGKTITVTSPAGGTTWQTGSQQNITWGSTNLTGNVKIELVKAGTVNSEIAASTENDGNHQWTVDGALAAAVDYQVRVSSVDFPSVTGQSASFSLSNLPAPVATTTAASNITMSGATLNGIVDPNNSSTVVTFEYGLSLAYGNTVTASQSPLNGSGNINVSAEVTGLSANTTVHFRVCAVNSNGSAFGSDISFSNQLMGVIDFDGNIYDTVKIGTQTWMKNNLKSKHYSDGSEISEVYAYEENESYAETYGRLYSWAAAMKNTTSPGTQGVCPTGWHIPTNEEVETLRAFLGGASIAGGKLKETGTDHWLSPNTGATNETNFTGLSGGFRYPVGQIWFDLHQTGYFCTSNESGAIDYWAFKLWYHDASLMTYTLQKSGSAISVRCLKD